MNNQDLIKPLKKLSKTSKAKLCDVGCFFVKNGAIISSGVNHNPTGEPMEDEVDGKLVSRPEVIHAEISAINSAKENNVDLTDSTLMITMSPCINCAKQIIKTGIIELNYLYEWWDKAAIELLKENGIKVIQLKEKK